MYTQLFYHVCHTIFVFLTQSFRQTHTRRLTVLSFPEFNGPRVNYCFRVWLLLSLLLLMLLLLLLWQPLPLYIVKIILVFLYTTQYKISSVIISITRRTIFESKTTWEWSEISASILMPFNSGWPEWKGQWFNIGYVLCVGLIVYICEYFYWSTVLNYHHTPIFSACMWKSCKMQNNSVIKNITHNRKTS